MTVFRHRTCTCLHGRADRFLVLASDGRWQHSVTVLIIIRIWLRARYFFLSSTQPKPIDNKPIHWVLPPGRWRLTLKSMLMLWVACVSLRAGFMPNASSRYASDSKGLHPSTLDASIDPVRLVQESPPANSDALANELLFLIETLDPLGEYAWLQLSYVEAIAMRNAPAWALLNWPRYFGIFRYDNPREYVQTNTERFPAAGNG